MKRTTSLFERRPGKLSVCMHRSSRKTSSLCSLRGYHNWFQGERSVCSGERLKLTASFARGTVVSARTVPGASTDPTPYIVRCSDSFGVVLTSLADGWRRVGIATYTLAWQERVPRRFCQVGCPCSYRVLLGVGWIFV